ncbi:MAG: hypothetical protein OXJ56_20180 [Rhodospirillaceae bacterium]|nr:hypothetical protein [Rhodospirillaceae bacterium]
MTEAERATLIGRTLQEHKSLKQHLGCLATKADHMAQAVAEGLRLITGETTGHADGGSLIVSKTANSMMVASCDWPSVEAIGELVAERAATEKRLAEVEECLRKMGMGEYVRGGDQ